MTTILTSTRWNAFLACACLTKSCRLLPHKPPWESFFFGTSSHIHDHHMETKTQAKDLFEMAHLELALHFSMASFKLMNSSSWLILNLHFILHSSSYWCLEVTWGLTSSSSSRHTWHLITFINFFLLQPWSQQMVQALPMDNTYKYNSMQTLVHRDCH